MWGLVYIRTGGRFTVKEGRKKALSLVFALRTFLSEERREHPAEVWLLDDGQGGLLYTSPCSIFTALRRHFKAMGWEKSRVKPLHG